MMKRAISILGLSMVLGACASALPQREPFPRELSGLSSELTEADAIVLARAAAQRHGKDLSAYEAPEVLRSNHGWDVSFQGKSNALGAHFSVSRRREENNVL
jgi:hypothetical protein